MLLSLTAAFSLHRCRKQACVLSSAVLVLALGILSTVIFEQARTSEAFRKADLLLNANTDGRVSRLAAQREHGWQGKQTCCSTRTWTAE